MKIHKFLEKKRTKRFMVKKVRAFWNRSPKFDFAPKCPTDRKSVHWALQTIVLKLRHFFDFAQNRQISPAQGKHTVIFPSCRYGAPGSPTIHFQNTSRRSYECDVPLATTYSANLDRFHFHMWSGSGRHVIGCKKTCKFYTSLLDEPESLLTPRGRLFSQK